jgi:phospholipase C
VIYARTGHGNVKVRDYAVAAGTHLEDSWALGDFENGVYHLRVYGPNGFYREFIGTADDPPIAVRLGYDRKSPSAAALIGHVTFDVANLDAQQPCSIQFHDNAYRTADIHPSVEPSTEAMVKIDTKPGLGWYDLSVRIDGKEPFRRRYAGRVETGHWSYSDPVMGRVVGQVAATEQANNDK